MKPLLLALCTLLAACGTKSDRIKVHIANAGPGLQTFCLPIPFAQTLGYYEAEGLDVSLETLPSVGKSLQALVGGSVDVAGVSYAQTLQLAAEGQHLRSFFIITRRGSNTLIVAPSATDRIRRIEDLKGALIGVTSLGSSSHLFGNYILAAHGIGPTEFRTINIGMGAPSVVAIESGRIDAAVVTGGGQFQLLRRFPNLRILLDSGTAEGMKATYGGDLYASGALAARPAWLAANPDTARRLARALLRTQVWLTTHTPEQIRERLPPEFRSDDAATDIEVLRYGLGSYTPDGKMPPGAPEVMKRYIEATIEKVRNTKIDLSATWTNDFLPTAK